MKRLIFCLCALLSPALAGMEATLPASLGLRIDETGNSWNLQENGSLGRIGGAMMNSGLVLLVNGETFTCEQPLMTVDGNGFLLPGDKPAPGGLAVSRRLQLQQEAGFLRYKEVISNPSTRDLEVSLEVRSSFSGSYKSYVSNLGITNPAVLASGETGIVVTPTASNQDEAWIFSLAGADSQLRPTLSSASRYTISAHLQVVIPAGETVIWLHSVHQVVPPQSLDLVGLQEVFQGTVLTEALQGIEARDRASIVNAGPAAVPQGMELLRATSLSSLGVEPSDSDLLAVGEETRLPGVASAEIVRLQSAFGEAEVRWEDVAALVGVQGGIRSESQVFLRNGEVFSGTVEVVNLVMNLASGGEQKLQLEQMDRLVLARDSKGPPEETEGWIETRTGSRLAIRFLPQSAVELVTLWGQTEVPLNEVRSISQDVEKAGFWRVRCRDGSDFLAYSTGDSVVVESLQFGEMEIASSLLQTFVHQDEVEASVFRGPVEALVLLRGDQKIAIPGGVETLSMTSSTGVLEIAGESIRQLQRGSDENWRLDLWNGGAVEGEIAQEVLIAGSWRFPIRELVGYENPSPSVAPEKRAEMERFIGQLGAESWQERDQAMRALRELGVLARASLITTLSDETDPEAIRRIERLLSEL